MRTKICGIRSEADLCVAVDAGADAIGLICGITHLSEDEVSPDTARQLAALAPPFVSTVLVTHLESADEILELAAHTGVDTIQVHGLVDLGTLRRVHAGAAGRTILRAVHVRDGDTAYDVLTTALETAPHCDALLLDSRSADRLGGTGRTHDWSVSRRIVEQADRVGRPVILAGGLTPENVASAVTRVGPYAVDVNSGVEDAHGDKSPDRCGAFVEVARSADFRREPDPR